jgi:hypothetical protein
MLAIPQWTYPFTHRDVWPNVVEEVSVAVGEFNTDVK